MTIREFEKLTGTYPTKALFASILREYDRSGLNVYRFCLDYLRNTDKLAERIRDMADAGAAMSDGGMEARGTAADTPKAAEPDAGVQSQSENINTARSGRTERLFESQESWAGQKASPATGSSFEPPLQSPETVKDFGKGVKGFVYLECPSCGDQFSIFLREPKNDVICRNCKGHIPLRLKETARARVRCGKCGNELNYRTTYQGDFFTVECRTCGAPVDLFMTANGDYVSERVLI